MDIAMIYYIYIYIYIKEYLLKYCNIYKMYIVIYTYIYYLSSQQKVTSAQLIKTISIYLASYVTLAVDSSMQL